MSTLTQNSFAIAPSAYASERPHYPQALFGWMASACPEREAAWDCATGNGQAAIGLAAYFKRVEATDVSPEQIGEAIAAPNIRYSAQPAEDTDFPDDRFDLVAVAQALHWFDFGKFWPQVRRVAKPDAFFCAWGYSWFDRSEDLGDLHKYYLDPLVELLEPYWAPNNRILWDGYRSEDIAFPFQRIAAPRFAIDLRWGIQRLIGYVRTWSAVKQAQAADPAKGEAIEALEEEARTRFTARGAMAMSLPLSIVAGRVSDA